MKKIIPALALLLISAMVLASASYAWFSMNTQVTATNMQVKAVAEQGILINEIADKDSTAWDNSATTNQTAGINLRATSTHETKTWYVAYSKLSNSAAAATSSGASSDLTAAGYSALSFATSPETTAAAAGTNAQTDIYYVDSDSSTDYTDGEGYYVKYTYYIKSSAGEISCGLGANAQNLTVVAPTVTGNSTSANLDKSLRVAVVVAGKAYIYAPLNDAAGTYYVNGATATTPLTGNQATSLDKIPAKTADGTPVYVYVWFEGEDTNLKTDNITTTLDNLTITVGFALVTNGSTAVTDNGVSVS